MTRIPYFLASDFGYRPDGNPATAAQNSAALRALADVCNPLRRNGVGGLGIIDGGFGFVKAGNPLWTGVVFEGETRGTMGATVALAPGSNGSIFVPHEWAGPGDVDGTNAFMWGLRHLKLDVKQTDQGQRIDDGSLAKGSDILGSVAGVFVVGDRLRGSGVPFGTVVAEVTPLGCRMSAAATQSIEGATLWIGTADPLCGVFARTNPLAQWTLGDYEFDPKGQIEDVEVRNCEVGFWVEGRSGCRIKESTVHASVGLGYRVGFDTQISSSFADYCLWGGLELTGSSCQVSGFKAFNSGQIYTTVDTNGRPRCLPEAGFGVRARATQCALSAVDCQQNTGVAFDLVGSRGMALGPVTASDVGFLAPEGWEIPAFDLTGAVGVNVQGTVHGRANGARVLRTNGSPGRVDLTYADAAPFTSDSTVLFGAVSDPDIRLTSFVW